VAHAILVTAYHVLSRQTTYQELGAHYYDARHAERAKRRAIQALERQDSRDSRTRGVSPNEIHRGIF